MARGAALAIHGASSRGGGRGIPGLRVARAARRGGGRPARGRRGGKHRRAAPATVGRGAAGARVEGRGRGKPTPNSTSAPPGLCDVWALGLVEPPPLQPPKGREIESERPPRSLRCAQGPRAKRRGEGRGRAAWGAALDALPHLPARHRSADRTARRSRPSITPLTRRELPHPSTPLPTG